MCSCGQKMRVSGYYMVIKKLHKIIHCLIDPGHAILIWFTYLFLVYSGYFLSLCACGKDGGEKITKCSFTWTCRGKEKQRETEEDLDGQCQGRPEREEHRLDQDW